HIVAHPNAWARIAKAKKADNSNESLVGSGTEAAERRLQSLPVLVDRDVPESSLLVLDKEAILSGYGNVEFAVSDQHLFHRRSYAARCWFRFGAVVAHPERVVLLGVGDGS
ncbi:phage major capsid protein, partial [Mycolicibacterium porcinum]